MRIIALSDFHGAVHILNSLKEKVSEVSPDVIIFSGDIVKGHKRGDEWLAARSEKRKPEMTEDIKNEEKEDIQFYETFFSFLDQMPVPTYLVPGNMDAPERRFLKACPQNRLVHQSLAERPFTIAGFGGEIVEDQEEYTFVLQYPRQKVMNIMERFSDTSLEVLITHSPPVSELSFEEGKERGSDAVNALIDLLNPEYLFCGHAHTMKGALWIETTLAVNPGALKYGNYAVVEGDSVEFGILV